MEERGDKHFWAPMLGMLPDTSVDFDIERIKQADRCSTFPEILEACPFFDKSGYKSTF